MYMHDANNIFNKIENPLKNKKQNNIMRNQTIILVQEIKFSKCKLMNKRKNV